MPSLPQCLDMQHNSDNQLQNECMKSTAASSTVDATHCLLLASCALHHADIDSCSPNPCTVAAFPNTDGVCRDKPAPNVGFDCDCSAGYTWNTTSRACEGKQ